MGATPESYIHGASQREQARLELMNRLLNERCLPELGLTGGERVLELGAGTGIFAAELASAVGPTGRVVAIERDEDQLRAARVHAQSAGAVLDLRQGDVYDPPLADQEWSSFDLVHARFLLEHLRQPIEAVRVMVRALRPGGRLILIDDDHSLMRMWPDPGPMTALWEDYALAYEAQGNDPWIGRKLAALAVQAGAQLHRTNTIHYGACAGQEAFTGVAENLAEVVSGAKESVLQRSDWTSASFDEALTSFRSWSARDDAAIWYSLPCVEALRPM